MICMQRKCLLSIGVLVLFAHVAATQEAGKISISGPAVQNTQFSGDELAKMPCLSIEVHDSHTSQLCKYEDVRVSDLLSRVGVPVGDALEGKAMATYVVARAADGYSVVYSLAELDPAMNGNQIIVADRMNGTPLDKEQGSFRVIVPGEKRPARWIRMLTSSEVLSAVTPSGSLPPSP
jgi:hypothetical protein